MGTHHRGKHGNWGRKQQVPFSRKKEDTYFYYYFNNSDFAAAVFHMYLCVCLLKLCVGGGLSNAKHTSPITSHTHKINHAVFCGWNWSSLLCSAHSHTYF